MARAAFLLPERARFGGQRLGNIGARALGRADRTNAGQGAQAQLRRHVQLVPDHWPLAALTRRVDADDAETACWLRADPAHIHATINGATLLACGDALALTHAQSDELLRPLRPLFGDAGFTIDAPVPSHWYLRMPREARLPVFTEPAQALGADVFEHLPEGDAGRRWRALLSEAQVILHNLPANARRAEAGLLPVNSLWFWGAGILPDHVSSPYAQLQSGDEVLRALLHGVADVQAPAARWQAGAGDALVDLRHVRELSAFENDWLPPALDAMGSGALVTLRLDFADGTAFDLFPRQRWRFWRRPLLRLGD